MHHTTRQQPDNPPSPGNEAPPGPAPDLAAGSWPRVLAALRHAGEQAGANAADWWAQDTVGGRAVGDVTDTARRVLAGVEDVDPAVLDALPACDLSGQWADAPTQADLYTQAAPPDAPDWDTLDEQAQTEAVDAYRDGYDTAVQDRVVRHCLAALPQPGGDDGPGRRQSAG